MSFLDFTIFGDQSVAFGAIISKDRGRIKRQVEILGELAGRVSEEADLWIVPVSDG